MFDHNAREVTGFDLESEIDFQRLQNPELMLGRLDGKVVPDEAHTIPSLLKTLCAPVNRPKKQGSFHYPWRRVAPVRSKCFENPGGPN